MKLMRKIIEIDEKLCNGCGQCIVACSEGAIELVNGKARLVAEKYCDGLGACLGECPQGAIKIYEREAEQFDPQAVKEYLADKKSKNDTKESTLECGCSSAYVQQFSSPCACEQEEASVKNSKVSSALTHWPVQIRLIPATAPFLKDAHLLIAADCTTVTLANLHQDYLKGKVVMIGCPKFDDQQAYVQKFTEIFTANNIKSITVLTMEVPCCQGLPHIVEKGMKLINKDIPTEQIVINTKGEIIKQERRF